MAEACAKKSSPAGCVLAVLLLSLLGAVSVQAEMLTVEDALGRTVQAPHPVHRLVALNSDAVEILRVLHAEDRLVGVYSEIDREPEFYGNLVKLSKVGSWREPNLEVMTQLEPDLIINYKGTPPLEMEPKMTALGLRMLRLDFYFIETMEREVRVLGRVLDRQAEAERFCNWQANILKTIRERLAQMDSRPVVYLESYGDYSSSGPGSGAHEMCVTAGGRNITANSPVRYPKVAPEWVISQNPEVVIKTLGNSNGYAQVDASVFNSRRDAIMHRPAWGNVPAVANRRVHVMDGSIWVGPRAIIGIAYMAKWIHPNLFRDFDPEALHHEFIEKFENLEYRGVFVSDPLPEFPK
jgi:iron complex transport system substrate-binding protein